VPHVEVLTWSIDSVRNERMLLTMARGPIAIDVGVDIIPMYPTAISAISDRGTTAIFAAGWYGAAGVGARARRASVRGITPS